jgi:hypothetical protein
MIFFGAVLGKKHLKKSAVMKQKNLLPRFVRLKLRLGRRKKLGSLEQKAIFIFHFM